MNDYRSQYGLDSNTQGLAPIEPPLPPKDYSLEEYLRLRDTLNSTQNKLPHMSEDKSVGFFVFAVKYVLPTLLLCVFLRPVFKSLGFSGSGVVFFFAALCYLIYKLPAISRALREQEAIDLAETQKAEYEEFLKQNEKFIKKNKVSKIS